MISKSALLRHYKRKDIQEEIIKCAEDREVAARFNVGFGKRPDVLTYPGDVLELAKQGVTSFHCSEELWHNPMILEPGMRKKDIDANRKGWDLVLDIDSDFFEYSKLGAHLIIDAIRYQGIKSVSVKFSGRAGFHIAIPYESFPEVVNGVETSTLFPDGARAIAAYLREMIREHLAEVILKFDNVGSLVKKTGKKQSELMKNGKFNPFSLLDIDTILISSRHLFRMPYTFNEKSGLVSVVMNPNEVLSFELSDAEFDKVKVCKTRFLDRENVNHGEATKLLVQAFDFHARKKTMKEEKESVSFSGEKKEFDIPEEAIPEECFPPCIKTILAGLKDGRQRSLFILINFLRSCGWSYEQISKRLKEWNKANEEELREVIIKGQLGYHKKSNKKVLPPNCANTYYKDLQICFPDNLCNKVKNPVSYATRRGFIYNRQKKMQEREKEKTEKKAKLQDKNNSK